MEMTDNSGLLLPLMATSFVAYGTSRLICPEPIYQALAQTFLPRRTPPPVSADNAPREDADTAGEATAPAREPPRKASGESPKL